MQRLSNLISRIRSIFIISLFNARVIMVFLLPYILPVFAGGVYFRYLPRAYRIVFWLTFFAVVAESSGFYIAKILEAPNHWLFDIYMLIDFGLMSWAAICLVSSKLQKSVFRALFLAGLLVWGINIYFMSIFVFANFAMVSFSIFLTAMFAIVLFNNGLFSSKSILTQPAFWLSIAAILYYSCNVPNMGLNNFLNREFPKLAKSMFLINTILTYVRHAFTAVSFILLGREGKKMLRIVSSQANVVGN